MNNLWRKLAIWLLDWLRSKVDPELKAKIDKYNSEARAQDELIKITEKQLVESSNRLVVLKRERDSFAADIALILIQTEKLKKDLEALRREETDLRDLPDRDVLRGI